MAVQNPPFDPHAGRRMKPKDAARWTKRYRDTPQQTGLQLTRAHYFGKAFLESLLDEPACAGLRFYQAIDDHGVGRVVVVGVDDQGNDLLPRKGQGDHPNDDGGVGETPEKCPANCDPNSPLMQ